MQAEKKLYRARGSLVGGVCTGLAEYLNIDPIIVQILTVVLVPITGGLAALVYIVMWLFVPAAPSAAEPVEVHPFEVHSEHYGSVPYYQVKQERGSRMSQTQTAEPAVPFDPYSGVAHVPPTPPSAVVGAEVSPEEGAQSVAHQAYVAQAAYAEGSYPESYHVSAAEPMPVFAAEPIPVSATAIPVSDAKVPFQTAPVPVREPGRGVVSGALWCGFILLFIGIMALFGTFIAEVYWWQLWPLIIVIAGIGIMVVPGRKGHRMEHFVNGLMLFALGASALTISLDIISLRSVYTIFFELWPMLIIMCGFFVLGAATRFPLFILLGGLVFVAFCIVGIGWFSTPGMTDTVSFVLPTGQSYVLDLYFWK
ncbi:MAG: PspC domain-containing protein [Eggerthellaceae bacterium]|nr:PspC domain-containing protein [Eggerthellaceae bacterium]